jgi:hypothetical protein
LWFERSDELSPLDDPDRYRDVVTGLHKRELKCLAQTLIDLYEASGWHLLDASWARQLLRLNDICGSEHLSELLKKASKKELRDLVLGLLDGG